MPIPSRARLVLLVPAVLLIAGCAQPPSAPVTQAPPSSSAATESSVAAAPPVTVTAPATTPPAVKPQAPIAPEQNPPGDIPDNQVFVAYTPGGARFSIKVPEGWSRTTGADTASFTDKLNTVSVKWTTSSSAPSVAQARATEVARLRASVPAFQLESVSVARLKAGQAVLLKYRQNGEPNAVTGKRYRLDVQRYTYYHSGTRVDLTLVSPVGADNVDPWRVISESLRWR